MKKTLLVMGFVCLAAAVIPARAADAPKVTLNKAEYRDKVYACWLGKNIGGTLGVPFEGAKEPHDITFYTNLKPGEPAANDDLDLQMLWLKAMEEHDGRVDTRILGEYWLKFVPVDWNEYGVGKRNMRDGVLPPLSGEYDNAKWKPSNGAWIRSEIWACLAPGCPALAATMAREDACVDHGAAEGTLAEIFTASVESAAFVEGNREKLIQIGLSMIPEDCGVTRAINAAIAAKNAGKDWKAARLDVIAASEATGWFQAPRNVAYTMLGWLYGDGDFGKSICIAVNCGDDTDCTGATLGSILGIIGGTKGIPGNWKEPIGTKINVVAISGFPNPKDLNELTDHTVSMAEKVLAQNSAPVSIIDGPTNMARVGELVLSDPAIAKKLWNLSPYRVVWNEADAQVVLDYLSDPVLKPGERHWVEISVTNKAAEPKSYSFAIKDCPEGWNVSDLPAKSPDIAPASTQTYKVPVSAATVDPGPHKMTLAVSGAAKSIEIPFTLFGKDSIEPDDLALATAGATAKSDGELDREPGCTPKAIDGIFATSADFSNRWHSSLDTPHPHWIEVKLAKPAVVGRAVIRFADPQGYPVSFEGQVMPEGSKSLVRVFNCDNNKNASVYRAAFEPVTTDTFRLVIRNSAQPVYPNAAQISEIELYPPKGGKK